jgi:chitinase
MSEDTNNLLRFFRSLRSALGRGKIISAMVSEQPWAGSKGLPLTDVSAFAAQISYLNIMYAFTLEP